MDIVLVVGWMSKQRRQANEENRRRNRFETIVRGVARQRFLAECGIAAWRETGERLEL